jgi:hypothetical protein
MSVCPKTLQVYIYGDENIWKSFPPYEDLQILGVIVTSQIIPHITLGNEKKIVSKGKKCNFYEDFWTHLST